MTPEQTQPGRLVLLPSGRPVEILGHTNGAAECRYLGSLAYVELRLDWLREHGKPYAINPRGAA